MFISKEEVEKKLKELAEELNQYELPFDIYLILIGGASLILKYNLKRSTHDIDVVVRPYLGGLGDILARKGFQIVEEGFLNLHPDYEERLQSVYEKGKVHILMLSPYDLARNGETVKIEKNVSSDSKNRFSVHPCGKHLFPLTTTYPQHQGLGGYFIEKLHQL